MLHSRLVCCATEQLCREAGNVCKSPPSGWPGGHRLGWSTPFQNRLVGTVIVASVIIIFLPDLLDGKKKSHQTDFEKIPQVPMFTGKINKNLFPEHKLVIKDKAIVFNEQAQDDLLIMDNTAQTRKEKGKDSGGRGTWHHGEGEQGER